ncbi:MAG: bacillithiol biosynthesis cysteine-adding enzyme BshC [Cryomorphaceae bacterium]|nr:bacillithiol biosynthesis cysteine-adding enzyme BshC [Cryomorphaceae bacterium]
MNDVPYYNQVDFSNAPHISALIKTYLKGDLPQELFGHLPNRDGLRKQAQVKSSHFAYRKELVNTLKTQYLRCKTNIADLSFVSKNIDALGDKNTVSITTGHQACLGGGPLFSVYKIITVIDRCRKFQEDNPEYKAVPVFWMATEDHDWEEANHFYIDDRKWVFDNGEGGAVGRRSTKGMDEWINQFSTQLPKGAVTDDVIKHLRHAYCTHDNWADATRQWVHDLFGQYGLVVIDGDDRSLKQLFLPVMEKELFGSGFAREVEQNTNVLKHLGFSPQAQYADVNLFMLGNGAREYPVRVDNGFKWKNRHWSNEAFHELLCQSPEYFSPNVILRPLYQECILPNISYVGGPGELAYWLQLKGVFESVNVPFPVLTLRDGFVLWTDKDRRRYEKLKVDMLFSPQSDWKKLWVKEHTSLPLQLNEQKQTIQALFDDLDKLAEQTDQSMKGAVAAQRAKQLKGIDKLEKKLLRAEKRQHKEAMQHIDKLLNVIYPSNIPQERHDSLWMWWLKTGKNPIAQVLEAADHGFVVLVLR